MRVTPTALTITYLDWRVLHTIADTAIIASCGVVAVIATYIYVVGQLAHIEAAFPALWRCGISFSVSRGISHFCSLIEIHRPTIAIFYVTGIMKLATAITGVWFASVLWHNRDKMAFMGRLILEISKTNDSAVSTSSSVDV